MRSARRTVRFCAVLLAGCNALLGIEERPLREDLVDGASGDGAPSGAYRDIVLADRPFVYFRFDEKSGTVAKDEMGHLDGTYPPIGVTLGTPGVTAEGGSSAVLLDGTKTIQVQAGVEFEGKAPMAVEAWFLAKEGVDEYAYLVDHERFEPRGGWELIAGSAGVFFERWANGSNGSSAGVESPPTRDTWHHLVGSFDGTEQRLYLDGQLIATNQGTADIPRLNGGFTIGGQNCECTQNFFTGAIDEVAIYDHPVSAARVLEHYRAVAKGL